MRFAHLKAHHRFERMRLRGLSGARDEFHLAAIVQNLKTLASHSGGRRRTYRTRISHDPWAQGLRPESTVAPRREAVNTAIGKSAN